MNRYGNMAKMLDLAHKSWTDADANGLIGIRASYAERGHLRADDGRDFINMCSCSYLGMDRHPDILEGAVEGLREAGTVTLPTSRTRVGLRLIAEVERDLSELFACEAVVTQSCAAASAGILPMVASGMLTGGVKPVMAFDKHCHFSMNLTKPICGDETEVVTCRHNDLDELEQLCRENEAVAYVADGAYSMGGYAPVRELVELQQRYALFLYFDDSHALSMYGRNGVGFVRDQIPELNDRTIVVGSLGKSFGVAGGVAMLSSAKQRELVDIYAGPLGWSQPANAATLGGIRAAARIHASSELTERQDELQRNIAYFDSLLPTENVGDALPIRVIRLKESDVAVESSGEMLRKGFYTSAVYFPIVPRGRAGLRVMMRSDLERGQIDRFCAAVDGLSV